MTERWRWAVLTLLGAADMSDRLLTAEELAERWQVKVQWVYTKTRAGDIPRVPLPGRYYRYRLDVIEAFERGELNNHTGRRAG